MKIGLTYDLRSEYLARGFSEQDVAEFDSDETIAALEAAVRALGHQPDRIGSAQSLCRRLVAGDRWDLVFNIAEGLRGRFRESEVPCLLELYGVPYTMSDPFVCAITLDKSAAKRIVLEAGLRTPGFCVIRSKADIRDVALPYPLFAKPLAEGTGKGVDRRSRASNRAELDAIVLDLLGRFHQPVLVEEFLPGREFTVGIIGTGPAARVIGTIEIEVLDRASNEIYSYESKEECERLVRYTTPAAGPLRSAVERLALESYLALECRDAGRVDVRLDRDGEPSFMEVNPLPGLHPSHSDLPMIATAAGMSHAQLIGAIIESAMQRVGTRTKAL